MKEQYKIRKYLTPLAIICATSLQLCLVLQSYLISLGPVYVSGAIIIYPLMCISLDIIAEQYGYYEAKRILWMVIVSSIGFAFIITMISKLPTPTFWNTYTKDFDYSFAYILRSGIIGAVAIFIGQLVNIFVLTKFRVMVNGKFFALRSISSTVVGDTVTVFIALFGNYVGRMSLNHIGVIIASELMIMYFSAVMLSGPGNLIIYHFKKLEKSPYNAGVAFNPFAEKSTKDF